MVGLRFNFSKKKLLTVVLAILPGAALCQPTIWAQSPAIVNQISNPSDARIHVKSRTFSFPLQFDVAGNPSARTVCLFMKDGGGEWVLVNNVSPLSKTIPCQVPHDGEFGFLVVTRDQHGRLFPANISQLPPAMTIVVESRRPAAPVSSNMPEIISQAQYPAINEPTGPALPNVLTPLPAEEGAIVAMTPPSTPSVAESPQIVKAPLTPPTVNLPSVASSSSPKRTIVNTTHVGIDFNVGRQGPSGLGKIEVWATPDQGRTWQRVGENRDHRSPVIADLPGEGVFGIRLVATNGSGFGGKVPSAGDLPATTIEVDLTSPVINSLAVDPVAKNGTLEITWKVTDKNLNPDSINLFYAAQRTGPWQPIAFRVKNDEVYHWTLPPNVPAQLFFRLEASDLAGNVSRSDTQNPILLDMTEPDVSVIGVNAIQGRVP